GPDPESAESTSNCMVLEVPPPGAGVSTVMAVTPADTIWAAGTWAVSWLALTNCVGRAVDPQYTVEADANPDPVTVSAKAAPAALVNAGERRVRAGRGFGPVTLMVTELEVEEPKRPAPA